MPSRVSMSVERGLAYWPAKRPMRMTRFLPPLHEHQAHLQQDLQLAGDGGGFALLETLGAVASLEHEPFVALRRRQLLLEVLDLPACDQREAVLPAGLARAVAPRRRDRPVAGRRVWTARRLATIRSRRRPFVFQYARSMPDKVGYVRGNVNLKPLCAFPRADPRAPKSQNRQRLFFVRFRAKDPTIVRFFSWAAPAQSCWPRRWPLRGTAPFDAP